MNEIKDYLCNFPGEWNIYLSKEKEKPYFKNLVQILEKEYQEKIIYPPINKIYEAFKLVPFEKIKLVIFGQDPYYKPSQANGLAFSLDKGVKITPSLRNIFKEINYEYGFSIPICGDLSNLAKQGVLLLNSYLTVVQDKPNSHKNIGWDLFINEVINIIEEKRNDVIYLLLGNNAKEKEKYIKHKNNIVYAGHPSPLNTSKNTPFIGSNCFKKVNEKIKKYYGKELNFNLSDLE